MATQLIRGKTINKEVIELLHSKYYFWLILFLSALTITFAIELFIPKLFTFTYWSDPQFKRSDVLRNVLLFPLGVVGLYIAYKRSTIAAGQLKSSETGLDIDRLQKAVELLQEDAVHSRVAGVISLHNIAIKSAEYRDTVVQVLITFLQSKESDFEAEAHFQSPSEDISSAYREWFERHAVKIDSIKALQALIDLDFSSFDINQAFGSSYKGIYLHGTYIKKMPLRSFTRCDLSGCTIKCKEGTLFVACDLTNATIIFENQKDYEIFHSCNISNMKLQVSNETSPVMNGWHWEGFPPIVASDWRFMTFPTERRIVRFDHRRIFPLSKLVDFYSKQKFGVPDNDPSFILDSASVDYDQQTLEQDSFESK